MRAGSIEACGTPREVLRETLLSDVFEHPLRVLTDPDTDTVYVETENSVYRLTFHAAVPLVAVA